MRACARFGASVTTSCGEQHTGLPNPSRVHPPFMRPAQLAKHAGHRTWSPSILVRIEPAAWRVCTPTAVPTHPRAQVQCLVTTLLTRLPRPYLSAPAPQRPIAALSLGFNHTCQPTTRGPAWSPARTLWGKRPWVASLPACQPYATQIAGLNWTSPRGSAPHAGGTGQMPRRCG